MKNKKYSKFDPLILFAKLMSKVTEFTSTIFYTFYDGVIPPLLGIDRLQELAVSDYDCSSMYMGQEHNTSGLYLWEKEGIGEYLSAGKSFLVLAAGGGREAISLLRKGVKVDAYECNTDLRTAGNRLLKNEKLNCSIQPMEFSKFPNVPTESLYDFCIVGWSAYSHILIRQDRIELLKGIKKTVKGPVLISFIGKARVQKIKKILRDLLSFLPGRANIISYDLVAKPGVVSVGFNENNIREEAAEAGYIVAKYKNHRPEYPYAVLIPDLAKE